MRRLESTLRWLSCAAVAGLLAGCPTAPPPLDPPSVDTPRRAAEPDPWEPAGSWDADAFAWGVQSGDATADGVVLSVRTTEPSLTLRTVRGVEGDDGPAWVDDDEIGPLAPVDGVVQLTLDELLPDTVYSYTFYADDGTRRSPAGRFRTAIGEGGLRVLTLGASHGFKGHQSWPSLTWAADERLDAYLLLGDTVYADDADELDEYREYWVDALSQDGMRELTASTSLVAVWDDHEVANNWLPADLDPGQFEAASHAYREALPQREGPAGSGVWRVLRYGATADVIVIDSRGERTAERYMSDTQLAWLEETLLASEARFKVILNSVPIMDWSNFLGSALEFDRWSGYPADRDRVLEFVDAHDIEGVLWLTGDFHMGAVGHVDPPGGTADDQWEVMVGTTGSTLNAMAELYEPDAQIHEMIYAWCYTWMELDPLAGTVVVRFVDDGGELLYEQMLEF